MNEGEHFIFSILDKKITRAITFSLTAISIILTLCFAIRTYTLNKTLIPNYEVKLQKKLEEQIVAISYLLKQSKRNVDSLIIDDKILKHMEKIKSKQNVTKEEGLSFAKYIKTKQDDLGFRSFTFINNNTSTVEYSTNSRLLGIRLGSEAYSNTPLFRSYFAASMTLTADFSDLLYSTILLEPAFYVTMPAFKDGKILGIFAYQVDDKKLNTITRDYLDLGKTGEIALVVQVGSQIHFITPTRNDPTIRFTKLQLFGDMDIQRAARGEKGSGISIDHRGVETLSAYAFSPAVDWGLVVKIDLVEVLEPLEIIKKYLIFFVGLSILCCALIIFMYSRRLTLSLQRHRGGLLNHIPHQIRNFPFILLLIFCYLSISAIYQYNYAKTSALKQSHDSAIRQVSAGIDAINADLDRIKDLADFIANDLQTERLISEDIRKRLRRDLVETDGLVRITIAYAPHNHSPTKRLYAPSIAQDNEGAIVEEMIEKSYDYSDSSEGLLKTKWYRLAMESGQGQWFNPSRDSLSNEEVVIYSVPFYYDSDKKTPAGVIAISYEFRRFVEIAESIGVGEKGYSFLVAKDGTFLLHPLKKNVLEQKTLLQFAQEEGNNDLGTVAEEIKSEQPILKQIFNKTADQSLWIYTHPIITAGWTIATVFYDREVGLGALESRKFLFKIISFSSLALLFLVALLCRIYASRYLASFLIFSNLVMVVTLISLWYTINATTVAVPRNHILITDQSSVNRFINNQKREAERKNEPIPIPIPCGIELYTLQQSNPRYITFSGYIWHKYHKDLHAGIQQIIRIPQATTFTIMNETRVEEGDWTIIGINLTATLYHEHDYTYYPFEQRHIVIPLEHADLTHNILLVPDLDGYTTMNPYTLPGLDTTFSLTSFYTTETYFDYTPFKPNADVGVRQWIELSDHYRLAYNAIIDVDLLVPFVFFFLPLLVILITIFAVLMLERRKTDPYTMVGPFTGLLFALVLLHRSLHEAAPATHTLYIEYAFFYTYIIIILLVIHTILLKHYMENEYYQQIVVGTLKVLFWPVQLSAWIITTLIIFY